MTIELLFGNSCPANRQARVQCLLSLRLLDLQRHIELVLALRSGLQHSLHVFLGAFQLLLPLHVFLHVHHILCTKFGSLSFALHNSNQSIRVDLFKSDGIVRNHVDDFALRLQQLLDLLVLRHLIASSQLSVLLPHFHFEPLRAGIERRNELNLPRLGSAESAALAAQRSRFLGPSRCGHSLRLRVCDLFCGQHRLGNKLFQCTQVRRLQFLSVALAQFCLGRRR
mmetsp:Transcript_62631/g.110538  ORF Transcript_62631/g.110538 Transcript_62631/m.110538 type:complete len:225 (-) Transcript_62631:2549-3223(-)